MATKLTKIEIDKPFTSHEATLKEMYVLDGFVSLMESLIEATRRRISDGAIMTMEELRFMQGELSAYQKILMRSQRSFKETKNKLKPLSEQPAEEVKI